MMLHFTGADQEIRAHQVRMIRTAARAAGRIVAGMRDILLSNELLVAVGAYLGSDRLGEVRLMGLNRDVWWIHRSYSLEVQASFIERSADEYFHMYHSMIDRRNWLDRTFRQLYDRQGLQSNWYGRRDAEHGPRLPEGLMIECGNLPAGPGSDRAPRREWPYINGTGLNPRRADGQ